MSQDNTAVHGHLPDYSIEEEAAAEVRERPIRAGVFDTIEAADRAIHKLLSAGFVRDQITVISSNKEHQQHYCKNFCERPSGARTPHAATIGAGIGATVGVLGAAGASAAVGSLAVALAAGPLAWTGAIFGGFFAAMMTRGMEKDTADFYDQAVQAGKILVAVEALHEEEGDTQILEAERMLREAGAEPIPLKEG